VGDLMDILRSQALRYRYTIMPGMTHGQWADLTSFGHRILTWHREVEVAVEQLEFLRRQGCDEAQGYLFAKALPAADLDGWLRSADRTLA